MVGRRLSEAEVESYDVCPAETARRVRVINIPCIPGGYAGMTLGRTVLLAKDVAADGDSSLLAHELVHVRQWTDQGVVDFSRRYVTSFAKNLKVKRRWQAAYRAIDAEVEARQETTAWRRRRSRDLYEAALEDKATDDGPQVETASGTQDQAEARGSSGPAEDNQDQSG